MNTTNILFDDYLLFNCDVFDKLYCGFRFTKHKINNGWAWKIISGGGQGGDPTIFNVVAINKDDNKYYSLYKYNDCMDCNTFEVDYELLNNCDKIISILQENIIETDFIANFHFYIDN